MSYERATISEIDRKLRDDFRRRLRDYGYTAELIDPILAVLFRSMASHIERIYSETEQIRLALLDELINGLGMERRAARPAQVVMRFFDAREELLIAATTDLLGEAPTGERLTFSTDATVAVSPARLSLAACYQRGTLKLLSGLALSEDLHAARPSLDPFSVDLGPSPALLLAFENLGSSHLSRHGFFFETSPYAAELNRALLSATWCLARADGSFSADGILRPVKSRAGIRALQWLTAAGVSPSHDNEVASLPPLPDGFYGSRCFHFPVIPPERRWTCGLPRGVEGALPRMFGSRDESLFRKPRAWIRVNLPNGIGDLERELAGILLHAVTASNLECLNQTIYFDRDGNEIPVSTEAGTPRYLVSPISVAGESGEYVAELEPATQITAGRYSIRNGRLNIVPAMQGEERADRFANLRLWVTAGAAANNVGAGCIRSFLRRGGDFDVRLMNATAAAGGTVGETFSDAHARFAHALLSRQRLISRSDLRLAVRAFDRRITDCDIAVKLQRTSRGLQRVHMVTASVNPAQFVDPAEETRVLQEELTAYLQERSLFDMPVTVRLTEVT